MNPLVKTAARMAAPHLLSMTRGRKRKMLLSAGKWAAMRAGRKQKQSMAKMAMKGLGAAVVAVPVGMLLGRMIMDRNRTEHLQ